MRRPRARSASAGSRITIALGLAAAVTILLGGVSASSAALIPLTSVQGFPNGRTLNDLPPNAIDGDTTTFTWTTNPNNIVVPSHLAVGFASTPVNRLRLWKERYGGGGQNIKNLTIQYTTDDNSIPLSSRTWTTVTGLVNGFEGTEFFIATSVNGDGTVTGDIHNSTTGDDWGSLAFDQVTATGLRVSFYNPNPSFPTCTGINGDEPCNHYRVGEFQARMDGPVVPSVGAWGLTVMSLLIVVAGGVGVWRERRSLASRS